MEMRTADDERVRQLLVCAGSVNDRGNMTDAFASLLLTSTERKADMGDTKGKKEKDKAQKQKVAKDVNATKKKQDKKK